MKKLSKRAEWKLWLTGSAETNDTAFYITLSAVTLLITTPIYAVVAFTVFPRFYISYDWMLVYTAIALPVFIYLFYVKVPDLQKRGILKRTELATQSFSSFIACIKYGFAFFIFSGPLGMHLPGWFITNLVGETRYETHTASLSSSNRLRIYIHLPSIEGFVFLSPRIAQSTYEGYIKNMNLREWQEMTVRIKVTKSWFGTLVTHDPDFEIISVSPR